MWRDIVLFPAQAGVIPKLFDMDKLFGAVPRASGGDPVLCGQ